jgi:site-specific recombinase XerD
MDGRTLMGMTAPSPRPTALGLGRGLGRLLPPAPTAAPADDPNPALIAAVAALPLPDDTPGRWTCRTATVAWLRSRRSAHTRRAYFHDLAGWLSWLDARGIDPRQAGRGDVDAWLASLPAEGRPAAASTVNRRLSAVSSWYTYLAEHDLLTRNPVAAVDRSPVDRDFSPTVGPTVAEVRGLLAAADAELTRRLRNGLSWQAQARNRALLGLLAGLGLRVGEALALDAEDLRHNGGHRTVVIRGNGGRTRELPLPAALYRPLDVYLAPRRREAAYDDGRWGLTDEELIREPLSGPLFVTQPDIWPDRGGRLRQAYVFALVRRLARAAGLPAADMIGPHSLRHAAATAALDDGAPLRDVQDLLGHADPRTTRRYDRNRGSLDRSPAHRLAVLYAE